MGPFRRPKTPSDPCPDSPSSISPGAMPGIRKADRFGSAAADRSPDPSCETVDWKADSFGSAPTTLPSGSSACCGRCSFQPRRRSSFRTAFSLTRPSVPRDQPFPPPGVFGVAGSGVIVSGAAFSLGATSSRLSAAKSAAWSRPPPSPLSSGPCLLRHKPGLASFPADCEVASLPAGTLTFARPETLDRRLTK
jgi:hypothetical protein